MAAGWGWSYAHHTQKPWSYTHPLTRGPRLSWEAWGSILTVTLKEKQMKKALHLSTQSPVPQNRDTKRQGLLPFLLSFQRGQLGLGARGFQEDPRRR